MLINLGDGRTVELSVPFVSTSPAETVDWGIRLGRSLPAGTVVGLSGELGAGKTLLSGAILHGAGLDAAVDVVSPTFGILTRYPGPVLLQHIDLSRLRSAREAHAAGIVEAILEPGQGVVVVEWFEKFPEIHPAAYLGICLEMRNDGSRLIIAGGPDG